MPESYPDKHAWGLFPLLHDLIHAVQSDAMRNHEAVEPPKGTDLTLVHSTSNRLVSRPTSFHDANMT